MHVIVHMHAIQPIEHTHQCKDKKQVQLELSMYFEKLMHMTTSTHLKISMDTLNECVSGSATPKKTMHMLANMLEEGVDAMHHLQGRQEFTSTRCHHEVHTHHRR